MNNKATVILNVQAEISQVKQAAQQIEKLFGGLNLSAGTQKSINSAFSELTKNVQNFEVAASKGINSLNDVGKVQKNLEKINDSFTKIKLIGKDLGTSDLEKFLPKEVIDRYKKLEDMLKKVKSLQSQDNSKAIQTATNKYNTQLVTVNKLKGKLEGLRNENKSLGAQTGNEKSGLVKQLNDAQKKADSLIQRMQQIKFPTGKGKAEYQNLNTQLTAVNATIRNLNNRIDENKEKMGANQGEIKRYTAELNSEQSTLNVLEQRLKDLASQKIDTTVLRTLRNDLASLLGVNLKEIPEDLEGIKAKLSEAVVSSRNVDSIKDIFQQLGLTTEQVEAAMSALEVEMGKVGAQQGNLQKINSEMDTLKSRLTYFFSAMNGFQLFKNAIRDAYNSIKDLDKAMTETAVVTKMSVQDLWNEMPRYTKIANDLGTTTLGAYQAMTLYYQQGLDNAEATALTTETLKMARIAGLEAAESTDLMTAALRGFNMELNETSAQRVNDVYSNLAANAAANTQEIADAMTRTASIANSAGMSFENTAAFLTQMINFATYTRVA